MKLPKLAVLAGPLALCACASIGQLQAREDPGAASMSWEPDVATVPYARSSAVPPAALWYFNLKSLPYAADAAGAPRWFTLGELHN
jgi:hypothetical protein